MNFAEVKKACESWAAEEPHRDLVEIDESGGKFVFLVGKKSFYCVTPEHNNGSWVSATNAESNGTSFSLRVFRTSG